MDIQSQNIIQEKIKNLPKEVQDALASEELSTKIRAVGNRHHLHIDQIGSMEDEVILAMIGVSEAAELPEQLVEQLSISKADADTLVNDINETIFLPLQNEMKKSDASKSVVMPSSVAAAAEVAPKVEPSPVTFKTMDVSSKPAVAATPVAPANKPLSTDVQIEAPHVEAEVMFNEPTVSLPQKAVSAAAADTQSKPPAPAPVYKADPYREPLE